MSEEERVAEWVRWYKASQPSYKAWALHAVWRNEPELFAGVVRTLGLTLLGLMEQMEDSGAALQTGPAKHARRAK